LKTIPQAPADWYPDPGPDAKGRLRYWDGEHWTDATSVDGHLDQVPLDPSGIDAAWQDLEDPRAAWPPWVAGAAVALAVLATIASSGSVWITRAVGGGPFASLLVGGSTLYGLLVIGCVVADRRLGSSFRDDFGFRFKRSDIGMGFVLSLLARLASVIAAVPFVLWLHHVSSNTQSLRVYRHDPAVLIALVVMVLVVAPVIEELFFRGLLQRSLEGTFGPWVAVPVASLLFGLAHMGVSPGVQLLPLVAATAGAGVVLGTSFRLSRRLGRSIAVHAWFNLLPTVLILIAAR
jgi:membrane protease YdiL (CAAX protease family)